MRRVLLPVLNPPMKAVLTEAVGTAVLLMAIVGSGIAAVDLTDDVGLQLVFNAIATVAVLGVLVAIALPISGGSFNPAVTFADVVRGNVLPRRGGAYVAAQLGGGVTGTVLAHLMFERDAVSWSDADRGGWGRLLGELVATAGLVAAIGLVDRATLPLVVPAWILGAYLFTSSTSFANPAVTVGRVFTDSFSGIAGADVPWFIVAQLVGAMLGLGLVLILKEDS
ncbi:MAG: aquaporin [Aeromicrobium sp.]